MISNFALMELEEARHLKFFVSQQYELRNHFLQAMLRELSVLAYQFSRLKPFDPLCQPKCFRAELEFEISCLIYQPFPMHSYLLN